MLHVSCFGLGFALSNHNVNSEILSVPVVSNIKALNSKQLFLQSPEFAQLVLSRSPGGK